MNLQDFSPAITVSKLETLFKKQFSENIKFSALSLKESKTALVKTQRLINEFKRSGVDAQKAETNPKYLKLKMIEEAVQLRISNIRSNLKDYKSGSQTMTPKYVKALSAVASGTRLKESTIQSLGVTEGLAKVLESRTSSIALIRKIVESKQSKQALNEGEIDSAQTTLAAQDIADQIQTMIEKFADIRYKELPALQDSIRNSQGVEEASAFNDTVLTSLEQLTGSLETAKVEINNAVATLTGSELAPMDGDLDLDDMEGGMGDEMGMDDMGMDDDLGGEFDMDFEEEPQEEFTDLGRARR